MNPMPKAFLLALLATSALALPARADEVPPVVASLLATIETQYGTKPTYESAKADGSGNITITKLAVSKPAEGGGPAITFTSDEIDIKDVKGPDNGMYDVGSVTATGTKIDVAGADGQNFSISAPKSEAEDWYVKDQSAAPSDADALRSAMNIAKKTSSGPITITAMGQTITSDGYTSTWDGDPATGAGSLTFKLTNVVIPESTLAMADTGGMLKQLGYSGLTFDIAGDAKIAVDSGKMGIDGNFAYVGKDMGALKFALSASDVPTAFFAEMQKARAAGKEPDFNAMMPDLQNISFGGFTLRFEDASITKKVLPMMAAMMGQTPDALAANAGAMVQMSLMSLNNQAFSEKVATAVGAFLKDPKSITVALKPGAPIKVMELMTLNPANPGEAITKLGVDVTAND